MPVASRPMIPSSCMPQPQQRVALSIEQADQAVHCLTSEGDIKFVIVAFSLEVTCDELVLERYQDLHS